MVIFCFWLQPTLTYSISSTKFHHFMVFLSGRGYLVWREDYCLRLLYNACTYTCRCTKAEHLICPNLFVRRKQRLHRLIFWKILQIFWCVFTCTFHGYGCICLMSRPNIKDRRRSEFPHNSIHHGKHWFLDHFFIINEEQIWQIFLYNSTFFSDQLFPKPGMTWTNLSSL